jgi:hypothetical protein
VLSIPPDTPKSSQSVLAPSESLFIMGFTEPQSLTALATAPSINNMRERSEMRIIHLHNRLAGDIMLRDLRCTELLYRPLDAYEIDCIPPINISR